MLVTFFDWQALVVVKYLFQFGFFPWNDGTIDENPFFPPRIIGIEKRDNYASADLVLLLALFIHRSILKVSIFLPSCKSYKCVVSVI